MNFIAWAIVACEIGFWVFILGGLVARYIFGMKRAGLVLLAMTPVLDLILLIVTGIDIYQGATPTIAHSIAPLYIAISVVYGKDMIRWADERFRYYIKREGERPIKRTGYTYARHSMKSSLKHVLAYCIGALLLFIMVWIVGNSEKSADLFATLKVWGIIVIIDNAISVSYFIWPKAGKKEGH
ncbi:hypothetical protein QR721_12645 [Aciduricibacillus chroicocephali]|uniref:2TM domain-containing protein n=1 Tax=Aciduricibacillus chroicocephali TaxID=3054939 RepID=A0ABY9KUU6_9BACI|nr:hypothetical protein QR721_12645 [Bacillaceae bacterium 44XB]